MDGQAENHEQSHSLFSVTVFQTGIEAVYFPGTKQECCLMPACMETRGKVSILRVCALETSFDMP
jgi:hypothetical protein